MLVLHFIWISPVQLIVFTILVYRELGWSAFIATGMMVLLVPLQMALARGFAYLRLVGKEVLGNVFMDILG